MTYLTVRHSSRKRFYCCAVVHSCVTYALRPFILIYFLIFFAHLPVRYEMGRLILIAKRPIIPNVKISRVQFPLRKKNLKKVTKNFRLKSENLHFDRKIAKLRKKSTKLFLYILVRLKK